MAETPFRQSSKTLEIDQSIEFTEATTVPGGNPTDGFGKLWVRDDAPNVLVFTDDTGSDTVLGSGGGSVTAGQSGFPYNDALFYIDVQNPSSFDGSDPPAAITDLRGSFASAGTVSNVTLVDGHFNFNATTSEIDFGTLPTALEDLFDGGGTIQGWIRPEDSGESGVGRIASTTDSGTEGWIVYCESAFTGFVRFVFVQYYSGGTGSWETSSRVVPLNQWTHFAVVFDGNDPANDPTFYLDGVEYSITAGNMTQNSSGSGSIDSDAGNSLIIGNRTNNDRTFEGDIEQIVMWDRELSVDEIDQMRRMGFDRLDPNLIGIDNSTDTKDMTVRVGISSAGAGGDLFIQAGNTEATSGTHTAGDLEIAAGDSSAPTNSSDAGTLTLRAGDYLGGATAPGGDLLLRGGDGGAGSDLTIRGGEVSSGNTAGTTTIRGSDNTGTGTAGPMHIRAGDATAAGSGNDNGGALAIRSGGGRNGGTAGNFILRTGGPTEGTAASTGDLFIGTSVSALASGDPFGTFGGANTNTGDITISTDGPGSNAGVSGNISFVTGDTTSTGSNNPGDFTFTGGSFTTNGSFNTGANFTVTCGSANSTNSGGGGSVTLTAGNNTFTGTAGTSGAGGIFLNAGDHNATDGSGGEIELNAGDALGTDGSGGPITVDGGAGNGSGAGGAIVATAGEAGATGTGGAFTAEGGFGGATSGTGGSATVRGGNAQGGGGNGGGLTLAGGMADTSGTGGDVSLGGGTSGTTGNGGDVTIFGAGGGSTSGNGGTVSINGGDVNSGTPGDITITAGDSTGSDDGAAVTITGGDSSTGTPGSVDLRTTDSTAPVTVRTQDTFTGTSREHFTHGEQVTLGVGTFNQTLIALGTLDTNGRNMKIEVYATAQDDGNDAGIDSFHSIQTFYRSGGTVSSLTAHASDSQGNGAFGTDWSFALAVSGNDIELQITNASSITGYTANIAVWWTLQEGGFTS